MCYRIPLIMILKLVLFFSVLMWTGCQTSQSAPQPQNDETTAPELISVRADQTQLLFTYRDTQGKDQSAISIDEIPQDARAQVRVMDLSRSPQERKSRDYLQIFDLRQPDANGNYAGKLVKRDQLEAELRQVSRVQAQSTQQAKEKEARSQQPPITLYSASWCGYCKKARAFLKSKNLQFTEYDIEKNRSAAQELAQLSQRAGIKPGGVPVINVGGRMMSGFNPQELMKLVKQAQR